MAIDLLVEGTWLNVREGEENRFFINKGLHDLRDMFGRDSDRSRSIVLPRSPINIELLAPFSPTLGDDYKALNCQVYMSGVPVLEDAGLVIIGEDKNHYEVTILGGAANFYNLLSEEPLSALDFNLDNFEWTLANFLARVGEGSNVETGFAQWVNNDGWSQYSNDTINLADEEASATDIDKAGFFYRVQVLMNKIFANTGLNIDRTLVQDSYADLAVICPMSQMYEATPGIASAFGEVRFNNNYIIPPGANRMPFDNVIFNSGIWNVGLFQFEITEPAEFVISVQFRLILPNENPDCTFSLWLDPQPGGFRMLIEQFRATDTLWHTMNHRIVFQPDDRIYMETTPLQPNQTADQNGHFSMRSIHGDDRNILVSEWLPEISQKEFVKNIFNLSHIVAADIGGVITLSHFRDIETSPQIDLNNRIAKDRQVKYIPRLQGYGQSNVFKYQDDPRIFSTSFDATVEIPDNTLPSRSVKIELFFSGLDNTLFPEQSGGVAPAYDIEYTSEDNNNIHIQGAGGGAPTVYDTQEANDLKVQDILWIIDGGNTLRFVVSRVFDNKNGELFFDGVINELGQDWTHMSYTRHEFNHQIARLEVTGADPQIYYQGSERGTSPAGTTRSAIPVAWDSILEDFYPGYMRMIQQFQVLQVWVDIPNTVFLQLNSLAPIYALGNKYYLNKTEQYKENGLVRLELIRYN